MKKLILLLLLFVIINNGYCQPLSAYNFSAFSSTYNSVTTTLISPSSTGFGSTIWDDCWYNSIPIGFNFVYNCNTYTSLSASQNCWVMLGETFPGTSVDTYDDDLGNASYGVAGGY